MERDVRQMIHYLKQDKKCDRAFMIFFLRESLTVMTQLSGVTVQGTG